MRVLAREKIEVNIIVNIAHEKSYQGPFFDRLTECWICVLLDISRVLIEKMFILLCKVTLKSPKIETLYRIHVHLPTKHLQWYILLHKPPHSLKTLHIWVFMLAPSST